MNTSQFIINILLSIAVISSAISDMLRNSEIKALNTEIVLQNNRIEKLENLVHILQKDAEIKEVK